MPRWPAVRIDYYRPIIHDFCECAHIVLQAVLCKRSVRAHTDRKNRWVATLMVTHDDVFLMPGRRPTDGTRQGSFVLFTITGREKSGHETIKTLKRIHSGLPSILGAYR